jgi:hypothetical protein
VTLVIWPVLFNGQGMRGARSLTRFFFPCEAGDGMGARIGRVASFLVSIGSTGLICKMSVYLIDLQVLSLDLQVLSSNLQVLSSDLHTLSLDLQVLSLDSHTLSLDLQVLSPDSHTLSLDLQVLSPDSQVLSSDLQVLSPDSQVLSSDSHTLVCKMTVYLIRLIGPSFDSTGLGDGLSL